MQPEEIDKELKPVDDGKIVIDRAPLIFMIGPGPALTLVLDRARQLQERRVQIIGWMKDIHPAALFMFNYATGCIGGVNFPDGEIHRQFRTPGKNGYSVPKKNTYWDGVFKAQVPMETPEQQITSLLGLDTLMLDYSLKPEGDCEFMTCLADPGNGAGFAWISLKGPHCLWIADIPAYVEELKGRGFYVRDPHGSFTIQSLTDLGLTQTTKAEWDLLVAQRNVKQERSKKHKAR